MKYLKLTGSILCLMIIQTGMSQKPLIDSAAVANWSYLSSGGTAIGSNGNYFSYVIENSPVNNHTLVIQKIDND